MELSDDEYRGMLEELNDEQADIVQFVKKWCEETLRVKLAGDQQAQVKPFYQFLSGSGGVGKSHVIKAVYQTVKKILKPIHTDEPDAPTVLLVAPTGVSAFNIGNMTIHATYLLGTRQNYQSLSSEKQNALYNRLHCLHLVIIDEVSMVGSDTLFDIYRRLKEIMGRSEFDESIFGNVSILAVGDLY